MQKDMRVVVTGIGAITPIGHNVHDYWQALVQGVSGADRITRFDASRYRTQFACELKDYQPTDFFTRKELKKLDRYVQYALLAADESIAGASLQVPELNPGRVGVVWGTGVGGLQSMEGEMRSFIASATHTPQFSPFAVPTMIANMAGGHIAIKHGFTGPNVTTVSACASAANAIIHAAHLIQLGHVDLVISGGSEAPIAPICVGGFNAMRALSERNDSPQTASRPFDRDRDGFVLGEGAGALVLESYAHAQQRGAPIYAELVGSGMTADAYHITAPHPAGLGAQRAMEQALANAGKLPEAVDYINLHGTSTLLGDISEVKAIQQTFLAHAHRLAMSATKSMTGHLLGAAGAIEAVTTVLALQHQCIPPTINHFTADDTFDTQLDFTFNQAQPRPLEVALSNTFGFGGHNTCIAFQRWVD
ncbi:MAG: beta-ketoacyl-ACP synthase II [Bacteroidota bacterium]